MQTEVCEKDFTVAITFGHSARPEDFRCNHLYLRVGDYCVVDTDRGPAVGKVTRARMKARGRKCCKRLHNVIRKATRADMDHYKRICEKEKKVAAMARQKIADHELEMKFSHTEVTWDERRAIVYFTADGRVDFRDMVKSMASELNLKIEMRQIGTRDETRMLGGYGICGCSLCCSTFLPEFSPVSIRMAKDQGLSLNPAKISGVCGRLMCCLNYEQKYYKEMQKVVPRVGKRVDTPEGRGRVVNADYLRLRVTVDLGEDRRETFEAEQIKEVPPDRPQPKKGKKGKKGRGRDDNRPRGEKASDKGRDNRTENENRDRRNRGEAGNGEREN